MNACRLTRKKQRHNVKIPSQVHVRNSLQQISWECAYPAPLKVQCAIHPNSQINDDMESGRITSDSTYCFYLRLAADTLQREGVPSVCAGPSRVGSRGFQCLPCTARQSCLIVGHRVACEPGHLAYHDRLLVDMLNDLATPHATHLDR